jgi:hypothetical protein
MGPRVRAFFLTAGLALSGASPAAGGETEDRSTLLGAARAFHAAVESGELARVARFGCTAKGPFTEAEVKEAAKSVFATLTKIRGRAWEFGPEVAVKDVPGGKRIAVKTSPTSALLLTGIAFEGRWCFLSVDDLNPEEFTPRDPPVVDPAPTLAPAPAVDPEVERAVKEVVGTMLRVPAAGEDGASWLLWRRYGLKELPRDLVGELAGMLQVLRAPEEKVEPAAVLSVGGTAPHRHVRVRLAHRAPAPHAFFSSAWIVLLVEAEGWKVVRADLDVSPPPLVELSPVVTVAMPEKVVAAAETLLAAIDASDAKGFAAQSATIAGVERRRPGEADVKEQIQTLHGKYGARARKIGVPVPDSRRGIDEFVVPVLFGDGDDLLYLAFVDEGGAWRLSSLSEGSPADFVERPATPVK